MPSLDLVWLQDSWSKLFWLTTAACGNVLLWIRVISERQIQGHGILHNNHIAQFYGPFSTHPTPTETHPSSLKSNCLRFAVRKFYNKLNCDQRPPHLAFSRYIIHSWQKLRTILLTMNKFNFWTRGTKNFIMQPTMITHFKIIPLFQGKFSFWIIVLYLKRTKRSGLKN